MRFFFTAAALTLLIAFPAFGQSTIPPYHVYYDFLLASPGAFRFGLNGYDNPALLEYVNAPDVLFTWSDATGSWNDFKRWGLFAAVPNLGFGLIHQKDARASITDYRISAAFGNKSFSGGLSYGWSTGDRTFFRRTDLVSVGTLVRPNRYISTEFIGTVATENDAKEGVFVAAVRPVGTELLTLFADFALQNNQPLKNGNWSAGIVVEPLPGIRLFGRYLDSKAFTLGFQFSFGHVGLGTQSRYDRNQGHAYNTYSIRVGGYDRNILRSTLLARSRYLELNLSGPIKYQRYRLFDKSNTLADLLTAIDAAKSDPAVAGIAINSSGISADREKLWELREKLKEFKATGKHVVIFIDRPDMDVYHFASVADKIVMDPEGTVMLQGFVAGRTFLKGALEKLGIGFDELRFFKYKSAYEGFSRDKMSDADREQRQTLIDDFLRLVRADITEARKLSAEKFVQLVNNQVLFLPREALAQGLVDTLGRWDAVKDIVKKLEGKSKSFISQKGLETFNLPLDNYWGEKPRIAVIYALGVCAMDEGITARKLVKDVEAAVNDKRVKAIVLRVDSPGGDPVASDYIAEALKKAKGKKPVIISQGLVAASGGYWLSMYADTIVAAPNTLTGSIGVIGGWVYNKGFKEKLGMSTDFVKTGEHADLGFGATFPFLNIVLPDRDFTPEERGRAEFAIKDLYKEFVEKVSAGRMMKYDEVDSIAQGRIWSGYYGKKIGLVDELGGLGLALRIAMDKAGIKKSEEANVVEYPKLGLFNPQMFMPKFLGIKAPVTKYNIMDLVEFWLKHNGQPLPILPLDDIGLTLTNE